MFASGAKTTQGMTFVDRGDPAGYDWVVGSLTTNGTWHDLDCSSIVPVGAKAILFQATIKDDLEGQALYLRKNGNSNSANTSKIETQVGNLNNTANLISFCDSDRKIEYQAANTTWSVINIVIKGWWVQ